jgi:hypothetical protein
VGMRSAPYTGRKTVPNRVNTRFRARVAA